MECGRSEAAFWLFRAEDFCGFLQNCFADEFRFGLAASLGGALDVFHQGMGHFVSRLIHVSRKFYTLATPAIMALGTPVPREDS